MQDQALLLTAATAVGQRDYALAHAVLLAECEDVVRAERIARE